jgi:hypothetical protein
MKLPQLSLRDLFWLVLVCALAVGWCLERRRAEKLQKFWDQWQPYYTIGDSPPRRLPRVIHLPPGAMPY